MSKPVKPPTKFPGAQRALLEALFPEYEEYVRKHNPDFKGRVKELTRWRESKAKIFMEHPEFKAFFESRPEVEMKDWEDAICRVYINHYNNNMRRNATISTPTATSSTASSAASSVASTSAPNFRVSKPADDSLRRGIVTFLGDLSAREMFASENENDLKAEMDRIHVENPDLFGGALRNKALKILWDQADHAHWESKIAELADNVQENQGVFSDLMSIALQNLCNRKRLGSTIMSFSWAFRDPDTDLVKGGSFWTGYNAYEDKEILVRPVAHEAQADAWILHADAVLPRKPKPSAYNFLLNEDGIPLLPTVDLRTATTDQVAVLVSEYVSALWDSRHRNVSSVPLIPWDDIAAAPDKYFDVSVHRLPVPLKPLEVMQSNLLTVFPLYAYFKSTIDLVPFQFRHKDSMPSSPPPSSKIPPSFPMSGVVSEPDDGQPTATFSRSSSPPSFQDVIGRAKSIQPEEEPGKRPDSPEAFQSPATSAVAKAKGGRPAGVSDCNAGSALPLKATPVSIPIANALPGAASVSVGATAAASSPGVAAHDLALPVSADPLATDITLRSSPPHANSSAPTPFTCPSSSIVSIPSNSIAPIPSNSVAPASDPSVTPGESGHAVSTSLTSRATRARNGVKRKIPDTKPSETGSGQKKKRKTKKTSWFWADKEGKPIDKLGNPVYVDEDGQPMLDKNGKPFYVDLHGQPILS